MPVPYYGDYNNSTTVNILFNTFSSDDPSASVTVTDLVAGDVEIHKDGNVTQRSSDNGVTVSVNFDGVTGNHLVQISLSDNSDAGFYADGSQYQVRIEGATVDGATINAWIGAFSIGIINAHMAAALATYDPPTRGELTSDINGLENISTANVLTQAQAAVGVMIDGSNRVDVGLWLGQAVTLSTGNKPDVNIDEISDDTTAASTLEAMLDGMTTGAVEADGSNSTTQVKTDLAEATNDHYDVMTILFTSNDEAGQSRLITGYIGSSGTVSWNAALTGTPAAGSTFIIMAAGTTADAVWDEILTGSSHNLSTSAGKRLRQIEESFVHASGVIATVTDGHTITLDAEAVATADYYVGDRLQITEGTGAGQSRLIVAYTSGRVCTLDSNFTTNPNTSSLYNVDAADVHVSLSDADQAQGFVATYTDTTTVTLDAAAVAITDHYLGSLLVLTHGQGAGQAREITGYTNGRVVTVSPELVTALDTTTVWHIQAAVSAAEIADEVWDEAVAGHTASGSFGKTDADMLADTNELQGDDTPAAISGLNNISTANVLTQAAAALATTTYGEPATGAPGVTVSIEEKISWLYAFFRNETRTTATLLSLRNDANDGDIAKTTLSDDATTFKKQEFVSG